MVKNKPVPGEGQSLEDVIISEYLEGLRTTHTAGAKTSKSPYEQRFPTTPYDGLVGPSRPPVQRSSARGRARPRSRSGSRSRTAPREAWEAEPSSGHREEAADPRPRLEPARTEEDIVVIDVSGNYEEEQEGRSAVKGSDSAARARRQRPGSAPVNGRRRFNGKDSASTPKGRKSQSSRLPERGSLRSGSVSSLASSARPSSMRRRRKAPLYMRQPDTLVVTAFRNGRRDIHCRIAAPNVALLLEQATGKLQLPSAARRIFLEDGTEVPREALIPRDVEVYVSMGEPFKNPLKSLRRIQELKELSTWTMTGLQMPADHPRSFTKPHGMSKRFLEMNERKKRRILVFRNGSGSGPQEVVIDRDDIQGLLNACTSKLDIGSFARRIFLWDGAEVENLHEVPELHRLVYGSGGTPVLGPVWVAKSECFSPSGSEQFLCDVIKGITEKLRTANSYREQLSFAQNDEREKVNLASILSLSEEEVSEALEHVEEDIAEHRAVLSEYREMRRSIAERAQEERDAGKDYTMRHIEPVDSSSRLVGAKGLKVKVYENGNYDTPTEVYFNLREAERGLKGKNSSTGREKLVLERFMDSLSTNCHLAAVNSQARGLLARRLFDSAGREIRSVNQIDEDMELWLSHGENWIDPFTYCLNAELSKVVRRERKEKVFVVKEDASTAMVPGMERPSAWETIRGVPRGLQEEEEPPAEEEEEEEEEDDEEPAESVGNDNFFLQFKKNPSIVFFGEVAVCHKKRLNDSELFPAAGGTKCQTWIINQDGNIYLKHLPHLALGISDFPLSSRLPGGQRVSGFLATLMPKSTCDGLQRWNFESDGRVYNVANPGLALTYLGVPLEKNDQLPRNSEEGVPRGLKSIVGVCEIVGGRSAKYQRWGIKQERFDILGQWKNNEITNPEWSKRALTWPLDHEGKLNERLEWPMEGFLIPCAPPLEPKRPEGPATMIPKRLFALKNGIRDTRAAISVTGPDLTNMVKDRSLAKKGKKKKGRGAEGASGDSVDDVSLHCSDITLQQLEFQLFLERCTGLLAMPNAARRIFDSRGVEHFSLQDLERDELIYVTSGEPWADPLLSKEEVRRRQLICLISDDVDRVRQFVQLRAPAKLVMAADGALAAGVPMVVAQEVRRKRRRCRAPQGSGAQEQSPSSRPSATTRFSSTDESSSEASDQEAVLNTLTAHERACQKGDERLNRLKWPWERIVNDNGLDDVVNVNEATRSDDERGKDGDQKSYKKAFSPRLDPKQLQRFDYEDGFIFPRAEPNLALTIADGESRVLEVVLQKRRLDNVNQRWIIKPNGFIFAKYRHEQVLTVSMPKAPATAAQVELAYPGSQVAVQPLKKVQFGRANQMFCFNPLNGLIHAFHASALDKEITAANTVNACSYSILPDAIDQMGYTVYLPIGESKTKACHVCVACARALRGRYKLQRVEPGTLDFACSFGEAKRHGIREKGAWRCLAGKLDLSTSEAHATLEHWEETLRGLKQELTVRRVQSRLAESRTPRPVKVLAYHNGDGRLGQPELIVGSSMRGLMDQCQYRLGLPRAVRRLFTEDGTPMVDLEDLLTWYKENRQRVQLRQRQIQAGELAPELEEMREEVAMMLEVQGAGEEAPKEADVSSSMEMTDTNLEPELNSDEGCYEIGRPNRRNAIYELSITVTEMCKLEKLVPPTLLGDVHTSLVVTYSMFGEEIASDPFPNEECFSAERTTIRLRATFSNLKLFFKHNFSQLRFDLHAINADTNERMGLLGSTWVPLTTLLPRDCPELFRPVSMEGVYALYSPSTEPADPEAEEEPRGAKSGAMLCAEVKLVKEAKEEGEETTDAKEEKKEKEEEKKEEKEEKEQKEAAPEERSEAVPPPSEIDLDDSELNLGNVVIEVWASTGEAFVPLKTVYDEYLRTLKQRAARQGLSLELETQKHVLRQMQARRMEGMHPGEYRATMDPENPVLIQGNWQQPTTEERLKNDTVYNLQDRLDEIKVRQTVSSSRTMRPLVDPKRELYQQPEMLRVLVFPNGEDPRHAMYVWGESLHQLLDNASMRLSLRKAGKWFYSLDGKKIREFHDLERDQILCVSMGEAFAKAKEVHAQVEVRANWGRARRMYGAKATEVAVLSRPNAAVGVDPFGPPGLVRRPDPPPTFENKRVLVYENGKHKSEAVTVFADCLDALLTNATRRLNLRKPAVCFYNATGDKITHFDDVSRDEVLAVSTSGKSYIK